MGEKGTDGHAAPIGIRTRSFDELGQDISETRVERENASIVEQHSQRRGRHDLGDAGQIENGRRNYLGRSRVIGESAGGFERDDLTVEQDSVGRAWKCARGDGVFQNRVGGGEAPGFETVRHVCVLMVSHKPLSGRWRSARSYRYQDSRVSPRGKWSGDTMERANPAR